ncbi:hypothetical protein H7171_00670 [Candidatus Saccharibacteria bacterium]|nr:hypothetical protein [Candidatus Saccharibacteria bacterium]
MSVATNNPEIHDVPVERFKLGAITDVMYIKPEKFNLDEQLSPSAIYEVKVVDPYIEVYSAYERGKISAAESVADTYAQVRRLAGKWSRKPGTVYFDENGEPQKKRGWGDPASRDLFFNKRLKNPGLNAWRSKIPSSEALADLSDPSHSDFITGRDGEVAISDHVTKKWLSLCTDAKGIRSRATVMAEVVKQFIADKTPDIGEADAKDFRWMSVACGTALPAMKAALKAEISPDMMLIDLDKKALEATRKMAAEIGFSGSMTQRSDINIFKPEAMADLQAELTANNQRPMLIDAMGIFEYTGANLSVDSAQFLRSIYDILSPGGRLVFGQMRSDRPNPDFTMGVVSWPYVEMRSPKEFMQIIRKAGIPTKSTTLYLPKDRVYTVGVIDKPLNA